MAHSLYPIYLAEGQIKYLARLLEEQPLSSIADEAKRDVIASVLRTAAIMFPRRASAPPARSAPPGPIMLSAGDGPSKKAA